MSLVPSLLQAILKVDGEALVMHAGEKPYVVAPAGQIELASRGLTLEAVDGIVGQLLPPELQKALDEFGAVQYELPAAPEFPREHFTVVAARGGDDLWTEIRRRRVPAEDDRAQGEGFPSRGASSGAATAVAERPVVAPPPVAAAAPPVVAPPVVAPPVVAPPVVTAPAIAAMVATPVVEPPAIAHAAPVAESASPIYAQPIQPEVVRHEELGRGEESAQQYAAAGHYQAVEQPEPAEQPDAPVQQAIAAQQDPAAYEEPLPEDEEFEEEVIEEFEDDDLSLGDFGRTEGWYEEEEEEFESEEIDDEDALALPDAEQLFGRRRDAGADYEEFAVGEFEDGEEYEEYEEVEEYEEGEAFEDDDFTVDHDVFAPSQPGLAAQAQTPAPAMFVPHPMPIPQAPVVAEAPFQPLPAALPVEAPRPSAFAQVSQPFLLVAPPIVEAPRPLAQVPSIVAPPAEQPVVETPQPVASVALPVADVQEPAPAPQPAFVVEEPRIVAEAPQPVFDTPEPVAEVTPSIVEAVAAEETPAPVYETPEPVAEEAPSVVEAVATEETPAPVYETPEPVAEEAPSVVEAVAAEETPEPVYETPEPVAEVPSHVTVAPSWYTELQAEVAPSAFGFETTAQVHETREAVGEVPPAVLETPSYAEMADPPAAAFDTAVPEFHTPAAVFETPEPVAEVPVPEPDATPLYGEYSVSEAAPPPAPVFELVPPVFDEEEETVVEDAPPPLEAFPHAELPFAVVEAALPTATRFEPLVESAVEPDEEPDLESDLEPASEESDSSASWAARMPPATVLSMSRNPIRSTDFQPPTVQDPTMSGLDRLLRVSAARGASTLYLSTDAQPSVRVDGELQTIEGEPVLSARDVESLLLTLMPERSHEALRTGAATEWFCDIDVVGRVRCLSFRDHRGPGGVFRLMPTRSVSVDQLGLPRSVQTLALEPEGLVLVAGPRSSGKRTLLSAFVDQINKTRRDHVITIEREVNIVHEQSSSFVSQREVRGNDDDMLVAARAALREDPDVLVIEDLRTAALMNVALEAASAGRLVVAGFSAHTAAGAIDRIIDLYPPESRGQVQMALADCLRGVIVQVLLRNTSGGRVPAREVLLNSAAVSSVIAEGKTSQLSMAIEGGRRYGMMPINDGLVGLVQSGVVEAREAYRRSNDRPGFLAALKRRGIDTSFVEKLA